MPKNEDGEFELVLGNRQLLSVFFIVVILFGVFFTMGYIVGRNSAPMTAATIPADRGATPVTAANTAVRPSPMPEQTDRALAPGEAQVVQTEVKTTPPAAPPPAPATKVTGTKPAEAPPRPPEPKRREAATTEVKPVEMRAKPPSPPVAAPVAGPGQMYLQVAAVGRPDADNLVGTLKKRGFAAVVGPGPNESIFRVLVGPFKDNASAAKSKADLEGLGFKPWLKK